MDAITYNRILFDFASGRLTEEQIRQYSWLISCAAHTMKRFTNSVKRQLKIKGTLLCA
jgi:hypothetical protein